MKNQNVSFRRIGGRVVPIRINDHRVQGAALGAAGIAAAVATGKVSAGMMHQSAHIENEARNLGAVYTKLKAMKSQGPLFEHASNDKLMTVGRTALRNAVKSKQLEKAAFSVRNVGTLGSAALIGAGVHKALAHSSVKNDKKTRAAISTGAGVAATFAIRSAYLRGVGIRGFEVIKQAAKRAVLKI